jgi:hypothetical protein
MPIRVLMLVPLAVLLAACPDLPEAGVPDGSITAVHAGAGLEGGGVTGEVEISVDFDEVAATEHTHSEYVTGVTVAEPLRATREGSAIELSIDSVPVDDHIHEGYAAADHEHTWGDIDEIPAGFADGVDDGFTTEADLTSLLDDNYRASSWEPTWSEIADIPAGFADGVDNIGLTFIYTGAGLRGTGDRPEAPLSVDFESVARAEHVHADYALVTDLRTAQREIDELRSTIDELRDAIDMLSGRLDDYEDGTTWPLPSGTIVRTQSFRWFGLPPDTPVTINYISWIPVGRRTMPLNWSSTLGIEEPSEGLERRYRLRVHYTTVGTTRGDWVLEMRVAASNGWATRPWS